MKSNISLAGIASPDHSSIDANSSLKYDAIPSECEAALTSIVFGLAISGRHECSVLRSMLDSQSESPRSDFFKHVTLLLGDGGLQLADFLGRLGKLSNEVRVGGVSVEHGLLRMDYLLVELGARLSELRPVSGVNCAFNDLHGGDDGCPR